MSLSGSKSKTSSQQNQSFNQTQDTRLSDRAYSAFTDRMGQLNDMEYQSLSPDAYKAFENPYQQEVIDATTADINANRALASNEQRADFAKRGAFGDDRRDIAEAELGGQYDRTLATTLGALRSRGFEQAQGVAAGENANRNQYSQQTQAMINQLLSLLGNETTTNARGTSQGTSKGKSSNLGFSASWSDALGFGG